MSRAQKLGGLGSRGQLLGRLSVQAQLLKGSTLSTWVHTVSRVDFHPSQCQRREQDEAIGDVCIYVVYMHALCVRLLETNLQPHDYLD